MGERYVWSRKSLVTWKPWVWGASVIAHAAISSGKQQNGRKFSGKPKVDKARDAK